MDMDALPCPAHVEVERRAGIRVWPWWGPRTRSFDPTYVQDVLVWASPPLRAPRARDRREAFFGRYGRSQGGVRLRRPDETMLPRFVELADASAVSIRNYARTWGPLGICSHGRPCSHSAFTSRRNVPGDPPCRPLGWDGEGGLEPVEAWRAYARRAGAILRAAERLRSGRVLELEDWKTLRAPSPVGPTPPRKATKLGWLLLLSTLNAWLVDGDVRPQVLPSANRPDFRLGLRLGTPWWMGEPSWPLFGAIGLALARAVTLASPMWCDGCGKMYAPSRAPRSGERHYCATCRRKGIPLRDAQRARRARLASSHATAELRPGRPPRPRRPATRPGSSS
jgi:hypothetical protein